MTLRSSSALVAAVLFLGIIPGEMFKLYDTIPYFDKYLHFVGGFVIAMLLAAIFRHEQERMSPWAYALFIVSTSTLIGVLWEHAEYFSGYFTKDHFPLFYRYFHGGGLLDTLQDLATDIVGALAFVIFFQKRRKD